MFASCVPSGATSSNGPSDDAAPPFQLTGVGDDYTCSRDSVIGWVSEAVHSSLLVTARSSTAAASSAADVFEDRQNMSRLPAAKEVSWSIRSASPAGRKKSGNPDVGSHAMLPHPDFVTVPSTAIRSPPSVSATASAAATPFPLSTSLSTVTSPPSAAPSADGSQHRVEATRMSPLASKEQVYLPLQQSFNSPINGTQPQVSRGGESAAFAMVAQPTSKSILSAIESLGAAEANLWTSPLPPCTGAVANLDSARSAGNSSSLPGLNIGPSQSPRQTNTSSKESSVTIEVIPGPSNEKGPCCSHCGCLSAGTTGLPGTDETTKLSPSAAAISYPGNSRSTTQEVSAPQGRKALADTAFAETVRFMKYRAFLRWYRGAHEANWTRGACAMMCIIGGALILFAHYSMCSEVVARKLVFGMYVGIVCLLAVLLLLFNSTLFLPRWSVRTAWMYILISIAILLIVNTNVTNRNASSGNSETALAGEGLFFLVPKKHHDDHTAGAVADAASSESNVFWVGAATGQLSADQCNSIFWLPLSYLIVQGGFICISLLYAYVLGRVAEFYFLRSKLFLRGWVVTRCERVQLLVPALGEASRQRYSASLDVNVEALDPQKTSLDGGKSENELPQGRLRLSWGLAIDCVNMSRWRMFGCGGCRRRPKGVDALRSPSKVGCWRVKEHERRATLEGVKPGKTRIAAGGRSNSTSGCVTVSYIGETSSDQRPDGFGFWKETQSDYGERLVGYWTHGIPNGPHKSRETGTGSGFMCLRIGWAKFTLNEDSLKFGVANVECSVSGKFYRGYPHVKLMWPSERNNPLSAFHIRKMLFELDPQKKHGGPAERGAADQHLANRAHTARATVALTRNERQSGQDLRPGGGHNSLLPQNAKRAKTAQLPRSQSAVAVWSNRDLTQSAAADENDVSTAVGVARNRKRSTSALGNRSSAQRKRQASRDLSSGDGDRDFRSAVALLKRTALAVPNGAHNLIRRLRKRDIEKMARLHRSRRDVAWCLAELCPHTPNFGIQPRSEIVITVDAERGVYVSGYIPRCNLLSSGGAGSPRGNVFSLAEGGDEDGSERFEERQPLITTAANVPEYVKNEYTFFQTQQKLAAVLPPLRVRPSAEVEASTLANSSFELSIQSEACRELYGIPDFTASTPDSSPNDCSRDGSKGCSSLALSAGENELSPPPAALWARETMLARHRSNENKLRPAVARRRQLSGPVPPPAFMTQWISGSGGMQSSSQPSASINPEEATEPEQDATAPQRSPHTLPTPLERAENNRHRRGTNGNRVAAGRWSPLALFPGHRRSSRDTGGRGNQPPTERQVGTKGSHMPFYRKPTVEKEVHQADVDEVRVKVVRRKLIGAPVPPLPATDNTQSHGSCSCPCHDRAGPCSPQPQHQSSMETASQSEAGAGPTTHVPPVQNSFVYPDPQYMEPKTIGRPAAAAAAAAAQHQRMAALEFESPELVAEGWCSMDTAGSPEVLLYIHGYNNSHEESLQVLGQMAAFGNYPNHIRLFLFSWPAGKGFWEFFKARKAAEDARTHRGLHDLLGALSDNGIRQIHIMCHSMGARLFLKSFRKMCDKVFSKVDGNENKKGKVQLVSVTFLNPEYYLKEFVNEDYPLLRSFCNHISIFADAGDQALWWSETLSRMPALGKTVFGLWRPPKRKNGDNLKNNCSNISSTDPVVNLKQPPKFMNTVSFFHLHNTTSMQPNQILSTEEDEPHDMPATAAAAEGEDVDWLDLDVIDTTFMDQNVHAMRHTFWNLNREIIEDIRELMVTRKRARQRMGRLDRRERNVWVYRVAPSFLTSLWDFSI